ncbi:hypothetical protein ACCC97_23655 [Variovorax sp. Varisp85]|uniref:hypothetical protein n=1 Tax=Variovorax sp. Varisp85 TaxID=3243059 RepID=UPI0039A5A8CD
MLVTPDALHAARLALLSAAVEAAFRAAVEDGYDGLSIEATVDDGVTAIDLTYTQRGVPMGGQSL